MEIKKIPFRKSTKFVTLLLTSMLIASASAATYFSLSMTSTIEVYAADVYFLKGGDDGVKGLVVTLGSKNTTATLTGLRAYPNVTFTYTDPVRVRNNGSLTPNIRLAPSFDPSGNEADFVYVKFLLNATAVGDRRWLNYTSDGGSWTIPSATSWTQIGATTEWPLVVMTMANATATSGNTITIGITVDVD